MKLKGKTNVGLVLSGGGIKASAFHLGVCMALQEKGFKLAGGSPRQVATRYPEGEELVVRTYVGSSAGAFVSAVLASGYSIEELIRAFEIGMSEENNIVTVDECLLKPLRYRHLFAVNKGNLVNFIPNFLRTKSLVSGGIEALVKNGFKINGFFTTKGLEKYLRQNVLFTNEFSELGVDLYILGTQLNHSRKVIFGNFPETYKDQGTKYVHYAKISDAVAASTALPPVFAPYGIKRPDGKEIHYYDGEIRDTLSTHVATDHGSDLVISSFTTQPYHFNPEMGSLHKYGIPLIVNQALYQVIQQKIDKHIEHQAKIRQIYNAVDGYFKQMNLPNEHRDRLLDIITKRVDFKPNVEYIYIHPSPTDYEMFFTDHFSLNSKILARIVRSGFKAAITKLRKYDL